jgi:hypothetical protein
VLESVLKLVTGIECQRWLPPLGQGDYSFDVELYASTKMFASANSVRSFEASFGASSFINSDT